MFAEGTWYSERAGRIEPELRVSRRGGDKSLSSVQETCRGFEN